MKKRLRKKKYLGEFAEYGAPIAVRLAADVDINQFLDSFLLEAIEPNGCYFGGSGKPERFLGIIELGRDKGAFEGRLNRISEWVKGNAFVEKYALGQVFDLWYGPFTEIDIVVKKIS